MVHSARLSQVAMLRNLRNLLGVIVASVGFLAGCVSDAGDPQTSESPDGETTGSVSSAILVQGKYQEVWNTGTNNCLDQYAFGQTDGTTLVSWPCGGTANEAFYLESGTGYLKGYGINRCVTDPSTTAALPLKIYSCGAAPTYQSWTIVGSLDEKALRNAAGHCMLFSASGAAVTTYSSARFDCKLPNEFGPPGFYLPAGAKISVGFKTPWPAGGPTIIGLKNRCLDVYAYSTANGASVVGWNCGTPNGNANQQWTMVGSEIRGYGNKCLDAWNGSGNGAPVGMWDCNGNPWQQWTRYSDGTIVNNHNGRCLDLASYGTYNGVPLQLWDCYYGGNQVFKSDL